MPLLYNCLLNLLAPFALLRLLIKSRRNPEYRRHIGERFAYLLPPTKPASLWIHAVSVGEFLAIAPLLETLLARHTDLNLWISCTTPTGRAQIAAFATGYPQRIQYSYLPYDSRGNIRRFLAHVQPRGVVLMETEIWFNLLRQCQAQNIPTLLINARLSAKSLRGYYRFARRLLRRVLPQLRINAQNRSDAKRFRFLCRDSRISITPSLKFAAPVTEILPLQDFLPPNPQAPLWIAASTHEGEEKHILAAYKNLLHHLPQLRLCIAPRHPERRDSICKLIEKSGFTPLLRSQGATLSSNTHSIALLDTLGELGAAMSCASVAFIGGSLIARGGHNPLEAVHAGIPLCFGKSMFNFQDIAEQLHKENFVRQCDADTLPDAVQALLDYHAQAGRQDIITYSRRHSGDILDRHYAFIAQQIALDVSTHRATHKASLCVLP